MASSFIQKSHHISSGYTVNMKFHEYLEKVLREKANVIPSKTAISEICLCHLTKFEALLKKMMSADPMEGIDPRYCIDLSETQAYLLEQARPILAEAGFLPDLLECLESKSSHFQTTELSDNTPMLTFLQICDLKPELLKMLEEQFPDDLGTKHFAKIYTCLKQDEPDMLN